MAAKVKLSKDGASIDFSTSDSMPASAKKFRKSPEIEGFYRFVYENDLQREAFQIISQISYRRKIEKQAKKKANKKKK